MCINICINVQLKRFCPYSHSFPPVLLSVSQAHSSSAPIQVLETPLSGQVLMKISLKGLRGSFIICLYNFFF